MTDVPFWAWPLVVLGIGGLINCGVSMYFNLTRPNPALHFPYFISGMYDRPNSREVKE